MLTLPSRKPSYDRRHRVASRDGWPLAIYEYEPRGGERAIPVLCVHGANCRYGVYDGGLGFGLAPFLAARGFHVFAVDLRGRGLSAPRKMIARTSALVGKGWTLGDFWKKDLPAAFDFALSQSGAVQLDYVGHSLGGMLGLELVEHTQDRRVRRLVTVGSGDARAMMVSDPDPDAPERGRAASVYVGALLAPFAISSRYTPIHWAAKLGARMLHYAPPETLRSMLSMLMNVENMENDVVDFFLSTSLAGISSKKFWSYGALYRRSHAPASADKRHRYPTLMLAGGADSLNSVRKVRETFSRCTHPDSRFIELSKAAGASADYGHVDLLLGKRVEQEVFPAILDYLAFENPLQLAAAAQ